MMRSIKVVVFFAIVWADPGGAPRNSGVCGADKNHAQQKMRHPFSLYHLSALIFLQEKKKDKDKDKKKDRSRSRGRDAWVSFVGWTIMVVLSLWIASCFMWKNGQYFEGV